MDLRPPMLDDLGILPTLSWFLKKYQDTRPGIRLEKHIEIKEEDVPADLKNSIFRIVQEAMNNSAKYSQASSLFLFLTKGESGLELKIKDNGKGFDVREVLERDKFNRGLGLESMRERTEQWNGSFSIESEIGQGTVIRAFWPL